MTPPSVYVPWSAGTSTDSLSFRHPTAAQGPPIVDLLQVCTRRDPGSGLPRTWRTALCSRLSKGFWYPSRGRKPSVTTSSRSTSAALQQNDLVVLLVLQLLGHQAVQLAPPFPGKIPSRSGHRPGPDRERAVPSSTKSTRVVGHAALRPEQAGLMGLPPIKFQVGQIQLKLEGALDASGTWMISLQIQTHMDFLPGVSTPYSHNGTASIIKKVGADNVKYFFALRKNFFTAPRRPRRARSGLTKRQFMVELPGMIARSDTVEGTDRSHERIYHSERTTPGSGWTAGWPRHSPCSPPRWPRSTSASSG